MNWHSRSMKVSVGPAGLLGNKYTLSDMGWKQVLQHWENAQRLLLEHMSYTHFCWRWIQNMKKAFQAFLPLSFKPVWIAFGSEALKI